MYASNKLAVLFVSALSFASTILAAPVGASPAPGLAERAPYGVHNGWVSATQFTVHLNI